MLRLVLAAILATALISSSVAAQQSGPPPSSTFKRPKPPTRPHVVSASPCNPAGYNTGITAYETCTGYGSSASAASTATPPRCSRSVTDHCVQAYERGVRR